MRPIAATKPISSTPRSSGGHITSAALGLITGGKDTAIVANMCATHGLDPNSAT